MQKKMRVKLVRSFSGQLPNSILTAKGLGLTRVQQERVVVDTPASRGMVRKICHMVTIVEEGIKE